jgi:CheY-like chemotaxis protein
MPSHSQRPYVLLVEDSEDDAFFFRWSLSKCGVTCDLTHVADGAAAIQHLQNGLLRRNGARLPDLVFLDLKIPTHSGFEVLAWIRDQLIQPRLDVAVLSGSEHASDVERAKGLGAACYFVKPLSAEQLRTRLEGCQLRPESADASGDEAKSA